jgi:RNA polymerase sigma factor (sigma-70 family)
METEPLLIERSEVRELLKHIVHKVATDSMLQEDLMQEALIHLWRQESQRPGQTRSWYLQSCRFYLQNYLSQGHSVDSMKRRHARCPLSLPLEPADCEHPNFDSTVESVSARDMLESLSVRARPSEQAVLVYLADGFGVREIAQKLRVSHQAVSKHRQRIAALAIQLGISPQHRCR